MLCCPFGGRMLGHIEVDDPAAIVGKDDEHAQSHRGNREEVDGYSVPHVLSQERAP